MKIAIQNSLGYQKQFVLFGDHFYIVLISVAPEKHSASSSTSRLTTDAYLPCSSLEWVSF